MSTFEVKAREARFETHPNAERLSIGRVDGYQFIVGKEQFPPGTVSLGLYIPEQAIVPDWLLEEMGLLGKLSGKEGNRVKATKIRGILSQGLFVVPSDWHPGWYEGTDLQEHYAITKWEPPIPTELAGAVRAFNSSKVVNMNGKEVRVPSTLPTTYTDIDNVKKWPSVLLDGEEVVYTEKLHGTCTIYGLVDDVPFVTSKGIGGKGLVIEESPTNTYWRAFRDSKIEEKLKKLVAHFETNEIALFGEIIGVQDLMYGLTRGSVSFRAFDIYVNGAYLNYDEFELACQLVDIPVVPLVYRGPHSNLAMEAYTKGESMLARHIREGIVMRPVVERRDVRADRVILKSISESYLIRKGDNLTEFN